MGLAERGDEPSAFPRDTPDGGVRTSWERRRCTLPGLAFATPANGRLKLPLNSEWFEPIRTEGASDKDRCDGPESGPHTAQPRESTAFPAVELLPFGMGGDDWPVTSRPRPLLGCRGGGPTGPAEREPAPGSTPLRCRELGEPASTPVWERPVRGRSSPWLMISWSTDRPREPDRGRPLNSVVSCSPGRPQEPDRGCSSNSVASWSPDRPRKLDRGLPA